jgi:type II secretory pathway pseudopilin PulG
LGDGYGLTGVLVTLLILGGLAAAVLTTVPGADTGSSRRRPASLPGLVTQPPSGQISAAAQQACEANYAALQQAISVYQVEHGSLPTSVAEVQTYFRGSLSTPQYSLSMDPNRPGQIQVQTSGRSASDGNGNCRYA